MPTQLSAGVITEEFDLTTSVPAVATSVGAIAGIFNWGPVMELTLIPDETTLLATFGPPTSNNAETWFTASSFLAYTNSLYVVRAANTTGNSTITYLNAIANTAAVANVYQEVVLNEIAFNNHTTGYDANCMFIAKYPGARGNSLQVSVCDSANAYSSNLNMVGNSDVSAIFSINIGSTSATIVVNSVSGNIVASDAYAANLINEMSIGDYIVVGNNSTISTQYLQVNSITNISNVTVSAVALTFLSPYNLKANFTANTSNNTLIQRFWQYAPVIGVPPTQTPWVDQYNSNTQVIDGQHIVVVDALGAFSSVPGTILETYKNLSRATDAETTGGQVNYYKTVINQNSNYIWAVNDRPDHAANSALSNAVLSSTDSNPLTLQFNSGQDGETENSASLATVALGYDLFNSTENSSINLVMQGKPIGGTTVATDGMTVNNFYLANYLIGNLISLRKDCVLFVTPDDQIILGNKGNEAIALTEWRSIVDSSSYAVMDSGYKQMYDRYNNVYRFVPTNGDIAGLCAYTDSVENPWWSPAGFNRGQLKNVVQMRYNPDKTDRDLLYPNSVNPVVTFPNQGTVLYGDKTLLANPSAFSRINVRRLFLTLEKAISISAQYTLFEFNDAFTRAAFVNLITPYLRSVQALRGITDFYVQCDATNNTAQVVDSNQFVASIYIKPARSINFIQLNFVAVPTGVEFSTVVGTF